MFSVVELATLPTAGAFGLPERHEMKVTTLTVDYQVTRSRDFQSVRLGGSVQLELGEGDDKKECLEKARRWLAGQLNAASQEELEVILFGPKGDI